MNKKQMNFRCCDYRQYAELPISIEQKISGKDWVGYGQDNQFPQTIQMLVEDCSTLGTVVSMEATYVSGAGVDNDREVSKDGTMLSELLDKLVYDYICQGACTVQLLRNKYGELTYMEYVDVANCRLDEEEKYVYYSKNWNKYSRSILRYDRWTKGNESPNSIMYIKNPQSKGIYGQPLWKSALRDALTMVEASKANYNSIIGQFQPNTLLSFNSGVPDSDTQDEIEKAVLEKYCTPDGSKILITWADSAETAPTLQAFSAEDYTAKYQAVMDTCRENILCSMRVSEQLVGIAGSANSGFTSTEYQQSYRLHYTTQIRPLQDLFEKTFHKVGVDFKFNEFVVNFEDVTNNEQNNIM